MLAIQPPSIDSLQFNTVLASPRDGVNIWLTPPQGTNLDNFCDFTIVSAK